MSDGKFQMDLGVVGAIVGVLAALFAGLSWYEAHESRVVAHNDTVSSLEVAQRAYVTVEQPEARGAGQLADVSFLTGKQIVKVSGNSPAYNAVVLGNCQIGPVGRIATNGPNESDLKNITPLPMPAMMVPGSQQSIFEKCSTTQHPDIGFVAYGIVNYNDIFTRKHFTHFCYDNNLLISDAIVTGDVKKWKAEAIGAGQHLIPCDTYNDGN
jgi:hypothetical protein